MPITKVDSYAFYPGARDRIAQMRPADPAKTPWTALGKPLSKCNVTLVSTAGIYVKGDVPFDYEREWRGAPRGGAGPRGGGPTHREVPRAAGQDDCEYTHLHINTEYLRADRNTAFPVDIFLDYEREG